MKMTSISMAAKIEENGGKWQRAESGMA